MLVACRLAGLSALGAHYAGVKLRAMRADAINYAASSRVMPRNHTPPANQTGGVSSNILSAAPQCPPAGVRAFGGPCPIAGRGEAGQRPSVARARLPSALITAECAWRG